MTKKDLIKMISELRAEGVDEFYKHINKAHDEELSAEERANADRIANIHYGRVEAFIEMINIISKEF